MSNFDTPNIDTQFIISYVPNVALFECRILATEQPLFFPMWLCLCKLLSLFGIYIYIYKHFVFFFRT